MDKVLDADTAAQANAALLGVVVELAEALHDLTTRSDAIRRADELTAMAEDAALMTRAMAAVMRRATS